MADPTTKPVIFLAYANDRDSSVRYLRNLPEETRRLRQTLQAAQDAGLCEIVERTNTTLTELLDVFQDSRYRDRIALFHYAGHANGYQLLFETADGKPAPADAAGFACFLGEKAKQGNSLQLVFLNGCATQPQVEALLAAGVSAVIATSQDIDDAVATDFADRFYKSLAAGAAIGSAFSEAEAAVQTVMGSDTRSAYLVGVQNAIQADRWPWNLYAGSGMEMAATWNLPDAAGNPLFGLPPLPEQDLPDSPYRHLNWYRREDAEIFFGRGREIRDLFERVADPAAAPIILFYGQSGVGKSSLLAAGLLPRLEQSHKIRYLRRDQSLGLLGTLQAELGPDIATGWRQIEDQERPLTVILDQVEERYTRPRPEDPSELATMLAALQDLFASRDRRPQGKIVLAFRKEWLAEIEKQISEQKLARSKVFLHRLDRAGIEEVVIGPTRGERLPRQYGLTVDLDLPRLIADDLLADRGSSVAPTLQILLSKMWTQAKARNHDRPHFDEDLYDQLKVQGLGLDDFLDRQLAALGAEIPATVESGLALDLLAYHTTPLGTAEQRTLAEIEQCYAHQGEVLPRLIQICQDLYLLVDPSANQPEQPPASRLAHDTLAPHVRKRFDESDSPGQRARRILENRATEGEAEDIVPLDRRDFALVEAGKNGMRSWNPGEQELMLASRDEEKKRQRRVRTTWSILVLAVLSIAVLACVAWFQWGAAQRQAYRAKAGELAALSNVMTEQWPQRGLLLAIESLRLADKADDVQIPVAEQALRDALQRSGGEALTERQAGANSAAISLDGSWLVTGSEDGTTYLWDLNAVASSPIQFNDSRGPISAVAITPNGRWAVTGGDDGIARLWDITMPHLPPKRLVAHQGPIHTLAVSGDGRWLITAGEDGIAYRWDLADISASPAPFKGHQRAIYDLAISDDNRWLITAGWDGKIRKWELDDPSAAPTIFPGHDASIRSVAISPDAEWLLSGSDDPTAPVLLWSFSQETSVRPVGRQLLPTGIGGVVDAIFSQDGRWVAAVGEALDSHAYLWNLDRLEENPRQLIGHTGRIRRVLPAGNGWLLTISDDKTAILWPLDETQNSPVILRGHEYGLVTATAASDGEQVVTVDAGGNLRRWTYETPNASPIRLPDQTDALTSVVLSRDGRWLATASSGGKVTLRRPDDSTGEAASLPCCDKAVRTLAFSPDSKWLITAGDDRLVRQWSLDDLTAPIRVLEEHTEPVKYVIISEDGQWLVTGSTDNTVRLWDLADTETAEGETSSRLLADHGVDPYALAMSKDGRWVASGDRLGTVMLSDTQSQQTPAQLLQGHTGMVKAISFSQNGRWLATAGADGLVLWQPDQPDPLVKILAQPADGFNDVAISRNSRWLAAAGADGRLWLWDLSDLAAQPEVLSGNAQSLRKVAFTPNSAKIVGGTDEGPVLIWQVADPLDQPIRLDAHHGSVTAMDVDASGRRLLTGDNLGTTYLWSLDREELIDLACQVAARNLSEEERELYLGSAGDDQPTCPESVAGQAPAADFQRTTTPVSTATVPLQSTTPIRSSSASPTTTHANATMSPPEATDVVSDLTPARPLAASIDLHEYIERYLVRASEGGRAINDAASAFDVRIVDADVAEGQFYWRVIGVHHLTPAENLANHHVYVDVLDEAGQRMLEAPTRIEWTWEGNQQDEASSKALNGPATEHSGSIPIATRQIMSVWIAGLSPNAELPSDRVENLHTQHPGEGDDEPWNSYGHHSFYIVFQRTLKGDVAAASSLEPGEEIEATATPAPTAPTSGVEPSASPTHVLTATATTLAATEELTPSQTISPSIAHVTPLPQAAASTDWRQCLSWNMEEYVELYLARAKEGGSAINDAADVFGVRIVDAGAAEGETYWKAIGVHRLAPGENSPGSHSVGVLFLDENGQGIAKPLWVERGWTEEGEIEETRADQQKCRGGMMLGPGTEYSFAIIGFDPGQPQKSDRVEYLRTDHPREGSSVGLPDDITRPQSFFVVFQRTRKITPTVVRLAITEIMYDPPPKPEFIEVTNLGSAPVDLSGASFSGINYTFPDGSEIGPGESWVVIRDAAEFEAAHAGVSPVGIFTGKLANEGERIVLKDTKDQVLASVDYGVSGAWPAPGDLRGSLILVDPDGDPNDPISWRLSSEATGSPGKYPD